MTLSSCSPKKSSLDLLNKDQVKILALDQSIRKTGWVIADWRQNAGRFSLEVKQFGTFSPPASLTEPVDLLLSIENFLTGLIKINCPDLVLLENVGNFNGNPKVYSSLYSLLTLLEVNLKKARQSYLVLSPRIYGKDSWRALTNTDSKQSWLLTLDKYNSEVNWKKIFNGHERDALGILIASLFYTELVEVQSFEDQILKLQEIVKSLLIN